jgi:hypothetical protein
VVGIGFTVTITLNAVGFEHVCVPPIGRLETVVAVREYVAVPAVDDVVLSAPPMTFCPVTRFEMPPDTPDVMVGVFHIYVVVVPGGKVATGV